MLVFLEKCKPKGQVLVVKRVTLCCRDDCPPLNPAPGPDPNPDPDPGPGPGPIPPPNPDTSTDMLTPIDYEAFEPDEEVIVGGPYYLGHTPVGMPMNGGIKACCAITGSGVITFMIRCDGQNILTTDGILAGSFTDIPASHINSPKDSGGNPYLFAGKRLELSIISATGGPWRGMRICFMPIGVANNP